MVYVNNNWYKDLDDLIKNEFSPEMAEAVEVLVNDKIAAAKRSARDELESEQDYRASYLTSVEREELENEIESLTCEVEHLEHICASLDDKNVALREENDELLQKVSEYEYMLDDNRDEEER